MQGGSGGDWWVIKVTGADNRLSDFAIDGGERGPTDEQTHLVQLVGPATDTRIDHLRLSLPIIAGSSGGDCIRLLGNEPVGLPAELVDGLTIADVTMPACDRSGVAFQRGVRNVWISRLVTRSVGDQAIDMEPTGAGTIKGVTIRDSRVHTGRGTGIAVTLTGNGGTAATAADRLVLDNVDLDGQVFMYNVSHATLRDLRVVSDGAAVGSMKEGQGIAIEGGYFERVGGTPGPVLSFSAHSGNFPSDVTIHRAHVVQRADGPAIRAEPGVGLDVDGGRIECRGPTPNSASAIVVTQVGAPSVGVRVRGMRITGTCKYGMQAPGNSTPIYSANHVEALTAAVWHPSATARPIIDSTKSTHQRCALAARLALWEQTDREERIES